MKINNKYISADITIDKKTIVISGTKKYNNNIPLKYVLNQKTLNKIQIN